MNTHRFQSLHLSRTLPTAAALLMIATGITVAQTAGDPPAAPAPDAIQATPADQAEPSGDMNRPERRQRRDPGRQTGEKRGDRQGPPDRMKDDRQGRRDHGHRQGPQGQADRPGQGLRRLMQDVNLTEAQQEQVRAVVREATTPMQEYMANNAAALREARDAMEQARADRNREAGQAARESFQQLREAGPQIDREALHAQVRSLLNASQQQVFDANLAEMQQRRQELQAQREQRLEQRENGEPRGDRPQRRDRQDRPERKQAPQDGPTPNDQLDL